MAVVFASPPVKKGEQRQLIHSGPRLSILGQKNFLGMPIGVFMLDFSPGVTPAPDAIIKAVKEQFHCDFLSHSGLSIWLPENP
ncbi:MAG: hypothetical protein JXR37_34110 [Kiritimatiellae bacterium]|nr:hypothetical protein [Kiritimatiellia bacterium]